jgi:DNA-binding GntR family transcriptional regulator
MSTTISTLRPLNSQTSLSQEVATRLREAIANGDLPPGARLVEREIAEQLGISRMPVREAIQQLADEGLVIKEVRRGAYVHPYSSAELEEIYSLRVVLERFVVERVITNWTDAESNRLQVVVNEMIEAAEMGNKVRVYELDSIFHETLWEMADHSILLEIVSGLRARIVRFLREATSALSSESLVMHANTHVKLVEVLARGDIVAAQVEISQHILAAKDRIHTYYQYLDGQTVEDEP